MFEPNPAGRLCECGCGEPTRIALKSDFAHGWVKGQPVRFLKGHQNRRRNVAATTTPDVQLNLLYTEFLPRPNTRAWVYAFWNASGEPLYVGKVVRFDYMGRLDEHSHKSPWWGEVAFYSVEEVPEPDVLRAEFKAIRKLRPKYNTANMAKCGTLSGYKAHLARNESACKPCREASNAHQRDKRRLKGINSPKQSECGTYGGYFAHLYRKEPPCAPCREANTEYAKARRRANGVHSYEGRSIAAKARWIKARAAAKE